MPVADGASRRTAVYACNGADACPHTGRAQSNLRGLPDQRPAHLVCEEGCVQPSYQRYFFWALIGVNTIAVVCAVLRMVYVDQPFWPTNMFGSMAASVLSWMQAKRFSELAASYALAAHKDGLIKKQSLLPDTPEKFSLFVGDAENAFSREHTQWSLERTFNQLRRQLKASAVARPHGQL